MKAETKYNPPPKKKPKIKKAKITNKQTKIANTCT